MDSDKFIRPNVFGMFDYDKSKKKLRLYLLRRYTYILHILIHSIIYMK